MKGSDWTKEQKLAKRALERAFKKCRDANLDCYGCDDSLLIIPSGLFSWSQPDKSGIYGALGVMDISNTDGCKHVNTHGVYVDSGGA